MIHNDRRLWIDAHIHVYADISGGQPRFDVDAVTSVMEADAAHLVWLLSLARPDYGELNRRPAEFVRLINEAQLELVQQLPPGRAFGSVMIHPGAVEDSLRAIEVYGGEHGFVQVGEILGYALGFELDTPEMVEIARHAARYGLPMQCHCSTTGQPFGNQIRQTISLARQVPEAKIVAAHAIGGGNSWLHITAAEVYFDMGGENLWLEIRDFNTRPYLRAAVQRLGAERLIVGTDWIYRPNQPCAPYGALFGVDFDDMPYPCSAASLEGFLREAGCTDGDVDLIAAGNSIGLFGLGDRLGL
ncbi:MAG: amidohydrolase family protein [Armatimonadetes bacterium]|nr:amidohydrolase family protein [Armatimonadota bacterium]